MEQEEYLYLALSRERYDFVRECDIMANDFVERFQMEPVYFARLPKVSEFHTEYEAHKDISLRPYGDRLIVYDTNRRLRGYPVMDICYEGNLQATLNKCRMEWMESSKTEPIDPAFSITLEFIEQWVLIPYLPKFILQHKHGQKSFVPVDSLTDALGMLEPNFEPEKPHDYGDWDGGIGLFHGDDD